MKNQVEQSKESVKKIPRSGKKNRTKGHGYEIKISNMLKDLGLVKTKTSRAASKLYDDCGIDHWGAILPTGDLILTQCKSGYKNSRPKADVEFKNQIEKMKTHFLPHYKGSFYSINPGIRKWFKTNACSRIFELKIQFCVY